MHTKGKGLEHWNDDGFLPSFVKLASLAFKQKTAPSPSGAALLGGTTPSALVVSLGPPG